jgi:hypothetical protein
MNLELKAQNQDLRSMSTQASFNKGGAKSHVGHEKYDEEAIDQLIRVNEQLQVEMAQARGGR